MQKTQKVPEIKCDKILLHFKFLANDFFTSTRFFFSSICYHLTQRSIYINARYLSRGVEYQCLDFMWIFDRKTLDMVGYCLLICHFRRSLTTNIIYLININHLCSNRPFLWPITSDNQELLLSWFILFNIIDYLFYPNSFQSKIRYKTYNSKTSQNHNHFIFVQRRFSFPWSIFFSSEWNIVFTVENDNYSVLAHVT